MHRIIINIKERYFPEYKTLEELFNARYQIDQDISKMCTKAYKTNKVNEKESIIIYNIFASSTTNGEKYDETIKYLSKEYKHSIPYIKKLAKLAEIKINNANK